MEVMSYKYETQKNENDLIDNMDIENKEENYKNQNIIPSSLLALLDDKNKSILMLKQQIHNQKLQLGFYLHRVFHSSKICDLADTCVPSEAEENLQINLAINKFCKQNGLQSRIMSLHQRMVTMEQNVAGLLVKQEELVNTLMAVMTNLTNSNTELDNTELASKLNKSNGLVHILASILGSINKLRKEIGYFRNATNRLVIIENERNNLVDKVYSMPVAQRLTYGAILATNYEKLRLEQEVGEIKEQQKLLYERLSHFPTVLDTYDENIRHLSTTVGDQNDIHKMLETVNTEAVSLLVTTKDQKDKYVNEISKLKESNTILGEEVSSMNQIKLAKEELEAHLERAKCEVEQIKQQSKNDFNEMKIKLESITEEREFLHNKLQYYYNLEEQLQLLRSNAEDAETIKQQRDYYKSQVEDLQAIRAAYAQLVQHCPIKSEASHPNDKVQEILSKVKVLENQKEMMNTEMKTLGEIITDQEAQIKHLLLIIKEMAQQPELSKHTTVSSVTQTETLIELDVNDSESNEDKSKSASSQTDDESQMQSMLQEIVCLSNSFLHKSSEETLEKSSTKLRTSVSSMEKLSKPNLSVSVNHQSAHELIVVESSNTTEISSKVTFSGNEKIVSRKSSLLIPTAETLVTESRELMQQNPSFRSAQICNCQSCPNTDTLVEITTINQLGKAESMRAVFQNSQQKVESVFRVNDLINIRITCGGSNSKTCPTLGPILSERELHNSILDECHLKNLNEDMDEYELMKDASKEVLVKALASFHTPAESVSIRSFSQAQDVVDSVIGETEDCSVSVENNFDGTGDNNTKITETIVEEDQEIHYETDDNDRIISESGDLKNDISITTRLKKITSELGNTLSQPGGKESLLNAVKTMYGTLFTDFNNQQVGS